MDRFSWHPQQLDEVEARYFSTPQSAMSTEGVTLSDTLTSGLKKVSLGKKYYYVKTYYLSGRNLRRYMGRSRVRAEWENLMYFRSLGLPTVRLVAFGEENSFSGSRKGILITEEVPDTLDLGTLAQQHHPLLNDRQWMRDVVNQVAENVRCLHNHGFIHGDLKWRNILVNISNTPQIYFIDSPLGRQYPWPLKGRGIVKDLSCLDKVAKYHLSNSSRMYFYHRYTNKAKIDAADKRRIGKILKFFKDRE